MEVKEFQNLCYSTARTIDKQKNLTRDGSLCVAQMVEEFGELAKEVNRERLRGVKSEKSALEDEVADVVILALDLAQYLDIDVESVVKKKIETLKERFSYLQDKSNYSQGYSQ